MDLDRSLAAFERGDVIATLSAYVTEIGLPGGVNAEATALVDIGVVAERRGRGLARALITAFLSEALARGEALAVLNTEILGFYEPFGFGVATTSWSTTLLASGDALVGDSDALGTVHLIEASEAATSLPEIFATVQLRRVGEVFRTSSWWEEHLADAAGARIPTEFAVVERDEGRRGYVAFVRPTQRSESVVVAELVAQDDGHAGQLIDFVRAVGGGAQVRLRAQPYDVITAFDGAAADRIASPQLWLRILDVEQALSLRRYAAASRTVLALRDELLDANGGHFLLKTHADGTATVARCKEVAAVTLDVGALARVFLGGSTFADLVESGEIVLTDDTALAPLDLAFSVPMAPFCSTLL